MTRRRTPPLSGPAEDGTLAAGVIAGCRVLIVRTGMGGERAAEAARRIFERFPVDRAVSLGFAGALDERAREGDAYACNVWLSAKGGEPLCLDRGWAESALEKLEAGGRSLRTGTGLTVERIVECKEEKRRLRALHGADIVDMETYRLAREARRHAVPLLSVRVVSDAVSRTMPRLDLLIHPEDCRVRWPRTLACLAARPRELVSLLSFAATARRASAVLTGCVTDLLAALQPGGETA